jgi:RimJ/RimL family protein N-acetyltransferase
VIETERLTLRPLSEDDYDAFAEFLGDPAATAGLHTPDPRSDPEQVRAVLDHFLTNAEMYTAVVRETGETAGFLGFIPRQLPWGDEVELGWLFLPAHWGRGYATEAARAIRPLKEQRIISLIRADNPASQRVARKLGATCERELEYYGYQTGVWVS